MSADVVFTALLSALSPSLVVIVSRIINHREHKETMRQQMAVAKEQLRLQTSTHLLVNNSATETLREIARLKQQLADAMPSNKGLAEEASEAHKRLDEAIQKNTQAQPIEVEAKVIEAEKRIVEATKGNVSPVIAQG